MPNASWCAFTSSFSQPARRAVSNTILKCSDCRASTTYSRDVARRFPTRSRIADRSVAAYPKPPSDFCTISGTGLPSGPFTSSKKTHSAPSERTATPFSSRIRQVSASMSL